MLKILLISIPILFVIGSLLHFAYDFSNRNKIVGLLTPVNESVFEHGKLLLTPLILFWLILYLFIKNNVDLNNYFFAMLVSIVISIITMISFYYTYKGIIGNEVMLVDILDLFISLTIGQIVANHVYVYSRGIPVFLSIFLLAFILFSFMYLTYHPFKIPLFFDKKNKTYGIKKDKQS